MSTGIRRGNGGFTLVELVIVIVVIAILVAALTPAIMGVVNRANRAADEADARVVLMASSIIATNENPPATPSAADLATGLREEFGSTTGDTFTADHSLIDGVYEVHFSGGLAVGIKLSDGRAPNDTTVGRLVATGTDVLWITINDSVITVSPTAPAQ
ncbi:MAG: prepilin-type N-terminal cleavage/methylation domain-containing protein [Defluviitaleaceae bacterium]|nr:prepilin-type N-terminal cleavage/methylation domain-containing protein [Defluviitaleaceae bacterium]